MAQKRLSGGLQTPAKPASFREKDPKVELEAKSGRDRIEEMLRHRDSLQSAQELLGCEIVAATSEGVARFRITKTRSFNGISHRTTNRGGIVQEAGMVYIMKHRAAKLLNITTGREGVPTCVWIEEAVDLKTGKTFKSNQLLKALGMEDSDGQPVFTERTAIVPGQKPQRVERLSPVAEGASTNTTGIFRAVFSQEEAALNGLREAVDMYTGRK